MSNSFQSDFTLVDVLEARAGSLPSARSYALVDDAVDITTEMSRDELARWARTIATKLWSDGVKPGDRALLVYPFGVEYVAAFFGCLHAGVVAVPVYPPDPRRLDRTLPRLRAIVRDAHPTVVLTTGLIAAMLDGVVALAPEFGALRWIATDGLDLGASSSWRRPDITPDTIAFLQYTSGSTSAPKGVQVSHSNLLHNQELQLRSTQLNETGTMVSWLPMYHDMGLIGALIHPLYAGAPCVLLPTLSFLRRPVRWLTAISRYGGTLSGGPNFAYDLCTRKVTLEEREHLDLRAWSHAFNGAEPVRPESIDHFVRYFSVCGFRPEAVRPLYGLAEATLMVSGRALFDPTSRLRLSPHSLERNRVERVDERAPGGRTLVGCGSTWNEHEVAIVSPTTARSCRSDEVGEIWFRGPSVARGYWNRPAESREVFGAMRTLDDGAEDGPWLRTGDLGFFDGGDLYITGRLKDLIIIRGRNHYPQDIEHTVEQSSTAIRPGCGAAFAVHEGDERLVVVHEVQRDRVGDDLQRLARQVRRAVAQVHGISAHAVVFIDEGTIPKTSSGKIQRAECRLRFIEDKLNVVHSSVSVAPEGSGASLRALIARIIGVAFEDIDPSLSLAELGLDSLQLLEVQQIARERLALQLDAADAYRPLIELEAQAPKTTPARSTGDGPFSVEWDITRDAPALFEHLKGRTPWIAEALSELRRDVPVPPTNDAFDDGRQFRPPGHFRAYYRRAPTGGADVLALKGAEVCCQDQQGFLQMLSQREFERFAKYSVTNVLEYFLIQEHKVPGALLLPEAIAEARRAAEVQSAFVERFGGVGPLPVPLLVVRWSAAITERFRTTLLTMLSRHPRDIAEREIERGLACYVYWFPCAPFPRVSHFAGTLAQEANRTGRAGIANTRLVYATLKNNTDPGAVVDGLITTVAQMLLCGFFPSDALHFKNGQCIEPQNVLLNGALADLDSVTPIVDLPSDKAFYQNFLAMLNLMANTVRVFLIAENNGTTAAPSPLPAQFGKPDFIDILAVIHVWQRLRARLSELRSTHPGQLDPRLDELVRDDFTFPLLFDRLLHSVYYSGPEIPEAVVHMLNITDVYGDLGHKTRQPVAGLSYQATLDIDAAALVTIPGSFLRELQLSSRRFVDDVLRGEATLLTIYDTFIGRIGLIVIPIDDQSIYASREKTIDATHLGIKLAEELRAGTIALTGMIPSATDYGRALSTPRAARLTTGHATTVSCFVMMLERILAEAGRTLEGEDVAILGLGSIGQAILTLALAQLPKPRSLRLCDLPGRMAQVRHLREELLADYPGRVEFVSVSGPMVPDEVYASTLILSATSAADVLDVDRLRPGTMIVDDSAPHCFDPRRALRRFQKHRDILFTEAGATRSNHPIREIADLRFATGWDHKVRSALRLLHPDDHTIMGCVFSSILTERFEDAPPVLGVPTSLELVAHYQRLRALKFEGAPLYCQDHILDPQLVSMFRSSFGRG